MTNTNPPANLMGKKPHHPIADAANRPFQLKFDNLVVTHSFHYTHYLLHLNIFLYGHTNYTVPKSTTASITQI